MNLVRFLLSTLPAPIRITVAATGVPIGVALIQHCARPDSSPWMLVVLLTFWGLLWLLASTGVMELVEENRRLREQLTQQTVAEPVLPCLTDFVPVRPSIAVYHLQNGAPPQWLQVATVTTGDLGTAFAATQVERAGFLSRSTDVGDLLLRYPAEPGEIPDRFLVLPVGFRKLQPEENATSILESEPEFSLYRLLRIA